jgi:hypothetical protein
MKRRLFLILIVGILTLGSLLSETQPAFAYCVYNEASDTIRAYDIGATGSNRRWEGDKLDPGAYDCCPGNKGECKDATVRAEWREAFKGNKSCQVGVPPRAALVITSQKINNEDTLICTINQ